MIKYRQVANHLLETYATGHMIAQVLNDIFSFIELMNSCLTDHAMLRMRTLRALRVYDEYVIK